MSADRADLDDLIARLDRAVKGKDGAAIGQTLEKIEAQLEGLNPLMRGTAYAHVQSVLGKHDEAGDVIESLLELMPQAAMLHYQLGCYRRDAGRLDDAKAAFAQATQHDTSLADAWIALGMLLDAGGDPSAAVSAYREVVLRSPTEVDGWRNLGNSLAALDQFEQAAQAYRTAHQLRPDDATLGLLRASCALAQGDVEAANALLPAELRESLGDFFEVRDESGARPLVYRGLAPDEPTLRATVQARLAVIGESLDVDASFPLAVDTGYVVDDGEQLLWCDEDAATKGRPHRFRLGPRPA